MEVITTEWAAEVARHLREWLRRNANEAEAFAQLLDPTPGERDAVNAKLAHERLMALSRELRACQELAWLRRND